MKNVKVAILRTAGTNCDNETAFAFLRAGAESDLIHINEFAKKRKRLSDYHILALPGGFTYGDDIASGKILANEIKYKMRADMERFISDGKLIVGICNGFQILVKMGLLPALGGRKWEMDVTLNLNDSAKFEDRWCYLKNAEKNNCVWTKGLPQIIYLPVAHGEGKFIPKDNSVLNKLKQNHQIVLRYCAKRGGKAVYPDNPNGSVDDIAAISDSTGRVLGMMPHPERYVVTTQHPRWTRERPTKEGDGAAIFRNGVDFVKANL
ncbi:MAG: phosphoribosylformylglycinamidine synthase I [Candidatus Omnitrophica bacterium]|nr:phosphoribosylformylglycinamidine synthase I [Candidatus Omnitrophota bacterium]MBU4488833.1 phosphoribosylformylglycinamidine synthase I [Candidatus Omnitrophota bacterium]MCG2704516.1 phosphoribosylformylglycinamidine synthase I [Candidatus Omnitrophota bacterium]